MRNIFKLQIILVLFIVATSLNAKAQCPSPWNVKQGVAQLESKIATKSADVMTKMVLKKFLGGTVGVVYDLLAPSQLGRDADKPEIYLINESCEEYLKAFRDLNYIKMNSSIKKLTRAVNEANKRKSISKQCFNDWKSTIKFYQEASNGIRAALGK